MTTPAADCGVTAGCGACPLGRAGVCGDPGTEPLAAGDYPRGWAVPIPPADTPDRDPAEPRPADAGCCGGACSA